MDCDRLSTSSERSLPGKCFVEFLVLRIRMLMSSLMLRAAVHGARLTHRSIATAVPDLNGVKEIRFGDGYISVRPVSKS